MENLQNMKEKDIWNNTKSAYKKPFNTRILTILFHKKYFDQKNHFIFKCLIQ